VLTVSGRPRAGISLALSATVIALVLATAPRARAASGEPTPHTSAITGDPAAWVDPRIGTDQGAANFGTGGGAGATFPGATLPFGMTQVSPDTIPDDNNFAAGYTYSDRQIRGFSLTHMSGAGCAVFGDIPILPTTAAVTQSPAQYGSFDINPRYVPSFNHAGEIATPGSYSVILNPGATEIDSELTATTRTAELRFRFPSAPTGSILFNAGGSSMGNFDADLTVNPATDEITGFVDSGSFCFSSDRYRVYFAAHFSQPMSAHGTWNSILLSPGSDSVSAISTGRQIGPVPLQYKPIPGGPASLPGDPTSGTTDGAYATFDTARNQTVEVRVGLSYVSVANAQQNLSTEAPPSKTFDQLRTAAHNTWNRWLSKIQIRGGSHVNRTLFYTALYHSLLMPNTFSDVNGDYIGMDGEVHRAAGYTQYANYSGWDIYRSEFPLLAMIAPRQASDMVSSLLSDYEQSGYLPKWPVANGQTDVMAGDPADAIIADAWAYGARRFDTTLALAAMVHGASDYGASPNDGYVERADLADYLKLGYAAYEDNTSSTGQAVDPSLVWGTAGTTLEYAIDDFAIARLARALRATATCTQFEPRSANWRTLFNPATRYIQPRDRNGSWASDFNPASDDAFPEGSAAQYTWEVPQDVAGLIRALGGQATTRARLETFLSQLNTGTSTLYAFLGNEPTLQVPYLADWVGSPSLAESTVRRALLSLYQPTPGGFPGNDDAGEMSSWWVLGALGIYPAIPGEGGLALASPMFSHTTIQLAHGTLQIAAPKASPARVYVHRLTLDGRAYASTWLPWARIARGGTLKFTLSARSGSKWGTAAADAPPSYEGTAVCSRS
jgi:predicted alpha-1,2-mannosidase